MIGRTTSLGLAVMLCALCGASWLAQGPTYEITVLKPDVPMGELAPSDKLVGKSIAEIFGPILEIRIETPGINPAAAPGGLEKFRETVRERLDHSKCLGRDAEVPWSKAPWVEGHVLLTNGRIIPLNIWLSGITVDGLLFGEAEGGATRNTKLPEPVIGIEEAIAIAKDFVQKQHIHVAESYIDSARLDLNPRGNRGKSWVVTWLHRENANGRPILGGQTDVRVYMDRSAQVFDGE